MYRIAFCDDDKKFIEYASAIVEDRFEQFHISVEVWNYLSVKDLLNALAIQKIDAIFLDMIMPEIDGMEAARRIRQKIKNRMIPIIFLSSHDSLVYSALQVQPLRFIRKKYFENEVDEAVRALIGLFHETDVEILSVRIAGGKVLLRINEILYIESLAKKQTIHMLDGYTYDCRITLAELEEQLKKYYFVRPHKSYLVNCRYIQVINTIDLQMRGNITIPLSRHRKDAIKQAFVRGQTKNLYYQPCCKTFGFPE